MKSGAKELRLPAPITSTAEPRTAVAAWVTQAGQIEPIQAWAAGCSEEKP